MSPDHNGDTAYWEELSPGALMAMQILAQRELDWYDVAAGLRELQGRGFAGIDVQSGRWALGRSGRAVYEDYRKHVLGYG